jgi:hypothetical protein
LSEQVLIKGETSIEPLCGKCGADVRPGSSHCYNCGGKVVDSKTDVLNKANADLKTGATRNGSARAKPRSRRVIGKPKTVEVVWKRTDGPGYAFILIALGIAAAVVVVLGLAYYLK